MKRLKAEDVRRAAYGRWLDILGALAGDVLGDALARRPGTHVDCPFHGGKKDFRLDGPGSQLGDAAENGGAFCTCGSWKDGFALLMTARGWSFPETLNEVGRYLGLEVSETRAVAQANRARQQRQYELAQKKRQAQQAVRAQRAIAKLRIMWDEAVPVGHFKAAPLRLYLASRGLTSTAIDGCPDLRYHPALPCYQDTEQGLAHLGDYPAMVAMVRDTGGEPVTLHRTYLTPQGAKLPVDKPKKLMEAPERKLQGGAIRLFAPGQVLGVAEGIETALSAQYATGLPTWSVVSASLLQGFEPPAGVQQLVIWADHDRSRTGIEAARLLQKRLWPRGIQVQIQLPACRIPEDAKSVDWNDIWQQQGRLGFPARPLDPANRQTA